MIARTRGYSMQTSSLRPSQFGSSAKTSKTAWFAASLVVCLFAVVFAAFAQKGKEVRLGPEVMPDADTPVTVTDDGTSFILSNGYLTATINKRTGDMSSLKVHGLETQGYVSGHHAGYWEQNPAGAARMEAKLTIDPASNGGERAEVSVKGWSDGKNLNGTRGAGAGGPRSAAAGAAAATGQDAPAATDTAAGAQAAPQVQLPPGVQRNRGTATGPRPGGF